MALKFYVSKKALQLAVYGTGTATPERESTPRTPSTNSQPKSFGLTGPGARSTLIGKKFVNILNMLKTSGN